MINYKFNNGRGAVICSECQVIVKEGLSYEDAVALYPDGALCDQCRGNDGREEPR